MAKVWLYWRTESKSFSPRPTILVPVYRVIPYRPVSTERSRDLRRDVFAATLHNLLTSWCSGVYAAIV